jgi:hypothetical protein
MESVMSDVMMSKEQELVENYVSGLRRYYGPRFSVTVDESKDLISVTRKRRQSESIHFHYQLQNDCVSIVARDSRHATIDQMEYELGGEGSEFALMDFVHQLSSNLPVE